MTAIVYLPDACECPSPRRFQSGRRLWELTNRTQCSFFSPPCPLNLISLRVCVAASVPGFLQTCYDVNPRIQQAVTPLASKEFVSTMAWCEVAATARGKPKPNAVDAGSNDFKQALQKLAISISGAHGSTHTVMVRWRSVENQTASKTTIFSVGFAPVELKTAFVDKAAKMMNTVQGFHLLDHELAVSDVVAQQGLRFYIRVPEGWADDTLMEAMIQQAGMNPDHVLSFGYDMLKKTSCNAPSGEMYFNFDPAGCVNHGAAVYDEDTYEPTTSIMQPPSSFFVTLPDGTEDHIKVRKVGACQFCWKPGGRHGECIYKDFCKVCLTRWDEMEGGGKRHACCQGDMFREKIKTGFNPNMQAGPEKPPSTIAEDLQATMLEHIREAKRKRDEDKMKDEFDVEQYLAENQISAEEVPDPDFEEDVQPAAKASKADIMASPNSASASQVEDQNAAPAEEGIDSDLE
jgi:hypothetical protein